MGISGEGVNNVPQVQQEVKLSEPLREGNGRLARVVSDLRALHVGQGFDARNLRHMRSFYSGFSKWNAVRAGLSWTHCRTLFGVEEF